MSFEGPLRGSNERADIRSAESEFAQGPESEESPEIAEMKKTLAHLQAKAREGARKKDEIKDPKIKEIAEQVEDEMLDQIVELEEKLKKAA